MGLSEIAPERRSIYIVIAKQEKQRHFQGGCYTVRNEWMAKKAEEKESEVIENIL